MNGKTIAMVLLAVSMSGCSSGTEPGDLASGPFTTTATTYTARKLSGNAPNVLSYDFTVVTRYTNATAVPIQLPACSMWGPGPLYALTNVDDSWPIGSIVYNPGVRACLTGLQSIGVAPGATRVDTLHLQGFAILNSAGTTSPWVVEGRFRMFLEAQSCPTPTTCTAASDAQRRSSPFTVRAG
jgi:hypothetical protein